jgi:predicted SAM-dependent methyltransferase
MKAGISLNLGCGTDIRKELDGFPCVNIDIRNLPGVDEVTDIRNLKDIPDASVDYILVSDIIEHFPLSETEGLLREWSRLLKKKGVLEIRTPSLKYMAEHYVKYHDAKHISYHIFGGQDYTENFHYVIFDGPWLQFLCRQVNLFMIDYKEDGSNFILKIEKR